MILKIKIMYFQELFTESKKLAVWSFSVVPKLARTPKSYEKSWWKANSMKNAPERRGPTAAEHRGGCPTPELHGGWSIQKFIAAEQQHQKVEDGATTHQEKGGEVYLGSEIHKAAQNFEKNENKRKKNRKKTENRKFQASGSSS